MRCKKRWEEELEWGCGRAGGECGRRRRWRAAASSSAAATPPAPTDPAQLIRYSSTVAITAITCRTCKTGQPKAIEARRTGRCTRADVVRLAPSRRVGARTAAAEGAGGGAVVARSALVRNGNGGRCGASRARALVAAIARSRRGKARQRRRRRCCRPRHPARLFGGRCSISIRSSNNNTRAAPRNLAAATPVPRAPVPHAGRPRAGAGAARTARGWGACGGSAVCCFGARAGHADARAPRAAAGGGCGGRAVAYEPGAVRGGSGGVGRSRRNRSRRSRRSGGGSRRQRPARTSRRTRHVPFAPALQGRLALPARARVGPLPPSLDTRRTRQLCARAHGRGARAACRRGPGAAVALLVPGAARGGAARGCGLGNGQSGDGAQRIGVAISLHCV